MGSVNPRERGREKMRVALDWIYRWGWASPSTIELTTGGKRSGLTARLVRQKFLKSTRTESGGGAKGIPMFILTLTRIGLEEVERHREDLIRYELDSYRIDQTKLRHDELAQRATINALLAKRIQSFKTPAELAAKSEAGVKQPDVLWIDGKGGRTGIEVELSAKWDRKLDQFVLGCLKSLKPDQANSVDSIALISDSKAIVSRYGKAFKPGQDLPIWGKDSRGNWLVTKTIQVPEKMGEIEIGKEGTIQCIYLES